MATIPVEGTILSASDNGSSWTAVAQVIGITPAEQTVESVETTVLAATPHPRTYRPSQTTGPNTANFRLQFDPDIATAVSGHTVLLALMTTPALKYFKITYNTSLTTDALQSFQGFLTVWAPEAIDVESPANQEVDVSIQITGNVTNTVGS